MNNQQPAYNSYDTHFIFRILSYGKPFTSHSDYDASWNYIMFSIEYNRNIYYQGYGVLNGTNELVRVLV